MLIYKKSYKSFRNLAQINNRISLLLNNLKKLSNYQPKSTALKINIRNVRESLSTLRSAKRNWANYIKEIKLYIL
jgi:conjugal transfer/entry exclusion protein